jgi:aspartate aminotransferase
VISQQLLRMRESLGSFAEFGTDPELDRALARPEACDFVFGNPHEVAATEYVDALLRAVRPTGPGHYAYTLSDPIATDAIAAGLSERFGLPFDAADVSLTNGNFAGLATLLLALVDPGDEVIFVSPPWFFYETLIVGARATPVRVLADRRTFDLDVEAIAAAITPSTRAIIVNTPNNPTGRIYPTRTLDALAGVLTEAADRNGHPIWLLSDEAYNRIVFDDREFVSPVTRYPWSFLIYTYGKMHLAPGSRLGYLAMPPTMPERAELREPLLLAQVATGWAFPVSLLQHALPELEGVATDVKALQRRRDRLVDALHSQGYDPVEPEGTFYILVPSPEPDDRSFWRRLADRDVYVLPGSVFEMPGFFRISLTANDDMVERAVPGFAAAIEEVRA